MAVAREAYRRRFATLLERALADDDFTRSGRVFTRSEATGNALVVELQSYAVPGDCAAFFINVAVLLGLEIESKRRHSANPAWRPTSAQGVWSHRLAPDGWNGSHRWTLCSPEDADREAERAIDSLHRQLPRLISLMDPDAMLNAAKQERWARSRVVEGYLLAGQGRVDDVEELLNIRTKDPSELVLFERRILELAKMRAAVR